MLPIGLLMARAIVTAVDTPPDLNLLRTFLTVYRAGAITAAAALLGLSQPTVTAQIRALEQQTGRELFTRLPRGVEPTPVAHELAARVAAPLDALSAVPGPGAEHAIPVQLAGPAELLSLRALPALAPLIAGGVQVRVTPGLTDALLDELRAGHHDLLISTRRPSARTFIVAPLITEDYVLVAAPEWATRLAPRLAAEGPCAAVSEAPLIAYAEDLPIARRYWRSVFARQLTVRAAATVPDLRGVLAAVTGGAGWSVLPRYLCAADLAAGRLVPLHEPPVPPGNTAYLVQRPGTGANPDVHRVRDHLLHAAPSW